MGYNSVNSGSQLGSFDVKSFHAKLPCLVLSRATISLIESLEPLEALHPVLEYTLSRTIGAMDPDC